jgi:hypothetical protein
VADSLACGGNFLVDNVLTETSQIRDVHLRPADPLDPVGFKNIPFDTNALDAVDKITVGAIADAGASTVIEVEDEEKSEQNEVEV